MLNRMEQETLALEMLLGMTELLPQLPNIYNCEFFVFLSPNYLIAVLADLGSNHEMQEMWLSAFFPIKAFLIVPVEAIQQRIYLFLQPIVEVRYPNLVNNGW